MPCQADLALDKQEREKEEEGGSLLQFLAGNRIKVKLPKAPDGRIHLRANRQPLTSIGNFSAAAAAGALINAPNRLPAKSRLQLLVPLSINCSRHKPNYAQALTQYECLSPAEGGDVPGMPDFSFLDQPPNSRLPTASSSNAIQGQRLESLDLTTHHSAAATDRQLPGKRPGNQTGSYADEQGDPGNQLLLKYHLQQHVQGPNQDGYAGMAATALRRVQEQPTRRRSRAKAVEDPNYVPNEDQAALAAAESNSNGPLGDDEREELLEDTGSSGNVVEAPRPIKAAAPKSSTTQPQANSRPAVNRSNQQDKQEQKPREYPTALSMCDTFIPALATIMLATYIGLNAASQPLITRSKYMATGAALLYASLLTSFACPAFCSKGPPAALCARGQHAATGCREASA